MRLVEVPSCSPPNGSRFSGRPRSPPARAAEPPCRLLPDPPPRRCCDLWLSVMRTLADPTPLQALAARGQDVAPKEVGLRARIVEAREERIEWEVLGHRADVWSLRPHHPVGDRVT